MTSHRFFSQLACVAHSRGAAAVRLSPHPPVLLRILRFAPHPPCAARSLSPYNCTHTCLTTQRHTYIHLCTLYRTIYTSGPAYTQTAPNSQAMRYRLTLHPCTAALRNLAGLPAAKLPSSPISLRLYIYISLFSLSSVYHPAAQLSAVRSGEATEDAARETMCGKSWEPCIAFASANCASHVRSAMQCWRRLAVCCGIWRNCSGKRRSRAIGRSRGPQRPAGVRSPDWLTRRPWRLPWCRWPLCQKAAWRFEKRSEVRIVFCFLSRPVVAVVAMAALLKHRLKPVLGRIQDRSRERERAKESEQAAESPVTAERVRRSAAFDAAAPLESPASSETMKCG